MDCYPLDNSSRRLERCIVLDLLEKLAAVQVEYPADLWRARKIIFATQLDETKKVGQAATRPTCS